MSIDYYKNLITSEHKIKSNFIDWLSEILTMIDGSINVSEDITIQFDIDTAIGVQLNIIGELVGVSRILKFQPISGNPVLDDETYRFLIKAKIAQNNYDGTINGMYTIWENSVGEPKIKIHDNQDMSFVVIFQSPVYNSLLSELAINGYLIPKPSGVNISFKININCNFDLIIGMIISTSDIIILTTNTPT